MLMKVTVIMPVYNEAKTIMDVLRLVNTVEFDKEIVVVDDCSTDGTRAMLKKEFGDKSCNIRIFYHERNMGKGGAIQTALRHAEGEYVIVQDADMEYSPQDMAKMARLAVETGAEAIYGSRFLATWKSTSLPHFLVNRFLTAITNVFFRGTLTDMETCYKMIKTDILREADIQANRFDFEPEVTAKLLKRGYVIREIPVSYNARGYDEGKKIGWRDGIEAIWTLVKWRFKK